MIINVDFHLSMKINENDWNINENKTSLFSFINDQIHDQSMTRPDQTRPLPGQINENQ